MNFDASDVKRLLKRWDYDPDAVATYGRALESVMRVPEAANLLKTTVSAYAAGESVDIKVVLSSMDRFAKCCGESPYTMRMLPYICMLDDALLRYKTNGISEDIYTDSFADLLWKTRECYRIYGVWGSFVAPWFYRFFELKCFALGRLQFELASFKADAPLLRDERVINVHIPSSGPLRTADCEESYEKAVRFFAYEREESVPFVCDSWLLHPMCKSLDKNSGIRRFAANYELLYVIDDPDYTDMWIIFGKPWYGDAHALPEDTQLRRLVKRRLLSGESVGRGYGLYQRKV